MNVMSFICGMTAGGIVGVVVMCLVQINRIGKWEEKFYEDGNE